MARVKRSALAGPSFPRSVPRTGLAVLAAAVGLTLVAEATRLRAQGPPQPVSAEDPEELAYHRAIAERARSLLLPLQPDDPARSNRVHAILMDHYQTLRRIHDQRDQALDKLHTINSSQPEARNRQREQILRQTRAALDIAHREFLNRLAVELSPEQIDRIKDGMTYHLADVTYRAYIRLLPELTEEHKEQIRSLLLEARELAMDEGSAREKHQLFNRYKGRINNYLSAAGYDLKEAERRLRASIHASRTNTPTAR